MGRAVLAQIFSNQYLFNMQLLDVRYSDQKLDEFKRLIQAEMKKAQEEIDSVKLRLKMRSVPTRQTWPTNHTKLTRLQWMDSKNHEGREMLTRTFERLVKKQHALKLALSRVSNKTYGIDQNTGELIDEQRLRALLTATNGV